MPRVQELRLSDKKDFPFKPQTGRIMNLPPELRLQIYADVLACSGQRLGIIGRRVSDYRAPERILVTNTLHFTHPLARACRHLAVEFEPVLQDALSKRETTPLASEITIKSHNFNGDQGLLGQCRRLRGPEIRLDKPVLIHVKLKIDEFWHYSVALSGDMARWVEGTDPSCGFLVDYKVSLGKETSAKEAARAAKEMRKIAASQALGI
jgi:hypothetical protein